MKQNVICIAGAHRSGTSMLTRLLHCCDLDLGPESDLMPAASDNPDGFWENLRFVRLNDEILSAVGAAWDLPPWQDEAFKAAGLEPMRAKAQLLIDDFREKATWGWKDPRNCLTMRFWKSMLPGLKTVIIVRNPLEVAYSMQKRNGTSYALGLRLWELYHRRLLANTQRDERIIVHYQAFFEEPKSELEKVAEFAGLDGKQIAAAAALVAVNRRHTAFTVEQMIDAGVARKIVALYRSLVDGTAQPRKGTNKSKRSSAVEGDQLSGTESKLNASIPESEDVRRELAARRGDEVQHREAIARFQKTIDGFREELARRGGRIEELQKAYAHIDQLLQREQTSRNELLAELERTRREFWDKEKRAQAQLDRDAQEIQNARQQSAHDAEELKKVRERFAQSNELLQKTSVRLADFETRNASLAERLRKQLLKMKRLLRLLDQMDDAAVLLRRSRRWKLANPVTALLAAFGGKPLQGYGHLDRNVEKYRSWRSDHPEVASLADEIQALRSREILSSPAFPEPERTEIPVPPSPSRPSAPCAPIEFPKHDHVSVSIIIPVYNQIDFTLSCLASVQKHSGNIPYEIIVVDDGSTDGTPEIVRDIPGLIYLRAESNEGFIAACNRGAATARGNYLVFLNNDTTVTTGWLAALRETFEFEPEAGLVGSKLVYPDGRLQEAGGIVWRDGSGWNRGKFQDPAKPEYNYLREVDYCSAASVMIPKTLFDKIGGFDSKYAPAYYEDTDLAFKIAQGGRKVLYQPLSVVTHYEGISSGTDISAGVKRYQAVNRGTFVNAWIDTLATLPENGDIDSFYAPENGGKRILVIDHHLPMPDRDSGSLRMFHILTILQRLEHQVTFIPDNLADIPPYGDELRKRGIIFLHHPYIKSIQDYLKTDGGKFDFIILSRCDFARKHIAGVRKYAPQSRVIFDTVDLHFLREERQAAMSNDPEIRRNADERKRLEYELVDQTDETWVVSPTERDLIRSARPEKSVEVVSNIVEVPGSALPFQQRRDILFIGSFLHPPNTDAVLFFARDIFPLVQQELGAVRFYVIGDKAPPQVVALADENIIVTGLQPDVRPYFDSVRLSIAPLRYGAGVKGKINQSMGFGVPVVATLIAVEGMGLTDHENVLVADTPQEFARAVIELYTSNSLWDRISQAGVEKTRALYSREAARNQLQHLISRNALATPSRAENPVLPSMELPTVAAQR